MESDIEDHGTKARKRVRVRGTLAKAGPLHFVASSSVVILGIDHENSYATDYWDDEYKTSFKWLDKILESTTNQPESEIFQNLPKEIEKPLKVLMKIQDSMFCCNLLIWNFNGQKWETSLRSFENPEDPGAGAWLVEPFMSFEGYTELTKLYDEDTHKQIYDQIDLAREIYENPDTSSIKEWKKINSKVKSSFVSGVIEETKPWLKIG